MKQTHFFTEVKSLPVAYGLTDRTREATSMRTDNASRVFQPKISTQLTTDLGKVGAEVLQSWLVIGDEFDLKLIGSVPEPGVLSKIDAICKVNGYEGRTHLAFEAGEYIQEFEEAWRRMGERVPAGTTSPTR